MLPEAYYAMTQDEVTEFAEDYLAEDVELFLLFLLTKENPEYY